MKLSTSRNAFLAESGKLALGVLLAGLLGGCNKVLVYKNDMLVRGYIPNSHGERNRDILHNGTKELDPPLENFRVKPENYPFSQEWNFHTASRGKLPGVCVALSGGGVRSAAFSIGVLAGLHERGVLRSVDIISVVSGGSFAASWFYAQHYHRRDQYQRAALDDVGAGRRDDARKITEEITTKLLKLDGDDQEDLSGRFSLLKKSEYYTLAGINFFPGSLVNLVANAMFGMRLNTTPARAEYELRIRERFHSARDESLNGTPISLDELGRFSQGKLPFLIINATALIEDDSNRYGSRRAFSIFEFTPLQFGSDAFGRFAYAPGRHVSLSRAVSISGAAFDAAELVAGPAQKTLWSLLNQDLGYYMNNPGIEEDARDKKKWYPFPFYFFSDRYTRDINASDIYLTDGGHSENLGVFSLARRLCGSIIIVDAEHDPQYDFRGYRLLKDALASEMNVGLMVRHIDEAPGLDQVFEERSSNGYEHTHSKRWRFYAKHPVMKGKICCFPYPGRNSDDERTIDVVYIKLAYHPAFTPKFAEAAGPRLECLDSELNRFFDERKPATVNFLTREAASFPQDPTTDQDYDARRYRNYRNLGYALVSAYKERLPGETGDADRKLFECPR